MGPLRQGPQVPETVLTTDKVVAGKMPALPRPHPATPEIRNVMLIEEDVEVAEVQPPALPKTGSIVPLLGLPGLLLTGVSVGLRLNRN